MSRTIVLSDTHLGASAGNDLLRAASFRERLGPALEGAGRVVLLGDIVELRDRPIADAVAIASPFFELVGEAAAGAEVVLVPGNHDHHLFSSWQEASRLRGARKPLGLEQRAKARSGLLGALAKRMPGCELFLSYPGIHLGDEIYAMHGHYLDAHLTVPTFERLGVGVVERVIGGLPDERSAEDYERVLEPLYAFLFTLAQSGGVSSSASGPSARAWAALADGATTAQKLRGALLGSVALPGAIAVANRLGLGKFSSNISLDEIGRATIAALREVIERLQIEAKTVIFGHTHRRGPPAGDDPAAAGPALLNPGGWVYSPGLLKSTTTASPYWPGSVIEIAGGEAKMRRLLEDVTHEGIREALSAKRV
ncbi:MAG: metallophosphoesterase [Solirubrobacterales bacterium]